MELLNQSENVGVVELDDTARENMTPEGPEMKVHFDNEKKAILAVVAMSCQQTPYG